MAANTEHPSVNNPEMEELLVTVADKLYHQHLQSFATTLIGLEAAEYNDIVKEEGEDEGKQCIRVSFKPLLFSFIFSYCVFFLGSLDLNVFFFLVLVSGSAGLEQQGPTHN